MVGSADDRLHARSSAYFFDLGGTLAALDRDEVARDDKGQVTVLPNVVARLQELRGQLLFIVTNQAGVALGVLSEAQARGFVEQVDARVGGLITDYRICMHDPAIGCPCRKPRPGMLLDLAECYGVDLARSVMIGDSPNDERCAREAGVGTFVWAPDFFGRASMVQT